MAGKKPVCKYGATCYRKNADHLKKFFHPAKEKQSESIPSSTDDISPAPPSKRQKLAGDERDPLPADPPSVASSSSDAVQNEGTSLG